MNKIQAAYQKLGVAPGSSIDVTKKDIDNSQWCGIRTGCPPLRDAEHPKKN